MTINPSDLLMVNIKGIYGYFDFLALRTKYGDENLIADMGLRASAIR